VAIGDGVDWRTELGGGVRVALIQAGTFTSDAGTIFGPVPRVLWEPLVAAELNPDQTLTQALNCLLIETPSGRVLVETGVGDRLDERRRAQRGVRPPWVVPALAGAGFAADTVDVVAVSHLHWDHAGGFLAADGRSAFPRARIVAQRVEWEFALGSNPRLQASYEQAELRLVEAAGLAGAADGEEELLPGVAVMPTSGHTGGSQAVVVRGSSRTVGFFGDLCMRPWSANPRWVPAFDDFPLTSVEIKALLFRQAAEEGWTVVLSHEPRQPVGRFRIEGERIRFEATV
jgi:glyoxylase-like metal-dependent hydrolase (beta-lactamase superfamily II)